MYDAVYYLLIISSLNIYLAIGLASEILAFQVRDIFGINLSRFIFWPRYIQRLKKGKEILGALMFVMVVTMILGTLAVVCLKAFGYGQY